MSISSGKEVSPELKTHFFVCNSLPEWAGWGGCPGGKAGKERTWLADEIGACGGWCGAVRSLLPDRTVFQGYHGVQACVATTNSRDGNNSVQ